MKQFFITGTDTDCGKTYATCQLLNYFNDRGKPSLALKPVASGCQIKNGQLVCDDVVNLQSCNKAPNYAINGWRFAPPISPHLAAKAVNSELLVSEIAEFCLNQSYQNLSNLFIEGAGGLLVPLNDRETWLDFLQFTQLPVILIVGMRLGCINHALLTAAVLRANQINCAGWIANCLDDTMLALTENISTLTLRMPMPLIAKISYQGSLNEDSFLSDL